MCQLMGMNCNVPTLTDNERWMPFSSGQLVVFHDGAPLSL